MEWIFSERLHKFIPRKNDYLYAHKQYSKLYQYSNKIEPKLANFNCSIFIDQNDDCTINNTEYFTKIYNWNWLDKTIIIYFHLLLMAISRILIKIFTK